MASAGAATALGAVTAAGAANAGDATLVPVVAAWWLMVAGQGCWFVAALLQYPLRVAFDLNLPFPSVADAGYLAFPVLAATRVTPPARVRWGRSANLSM